MSRPREELPTGDFAQSRATAPVKLAQRHPKSQPFDPDDLSKRLLVVLAQQEARAEKKRRLQADLALQARIWPTRPAGSSAHKGKFSEALLQQNRPKQFSTPLALPGSHKTRSIADTSANRVRNDDQDCVKESYRQLPEKSSARSKRATTENIAEAKKIIHKLSRKSLKHHLDGMNAQPAPSKMSGSQRPLEASISSQQPQRRRSESLEGASVHISESLRIGSKPHEKGGLIKHHRHTFYDQSQSIVPETDHIGAERHLSTGDAAACEDITPEAGEAPTGKEGAPDYKFAEAVNDHRVDWTQRDETRKARPKTPLNMRVGDSIWSLKARLGGLSKQGRGDKERKLEDEGVSAGVLDSTKNTKSGFFWKLKK